MSVTIAEENEVQGMCEHVLALSLNSMNELLSLMEEIKRREKELGICGIEFIEKTALAEAVEIVSDRGERRERSVTLGSEKAFQMIMEKFSNNEKGVFLEGGAK